MVTPDDAALVREFELKFPHEAEGSRQTDVPLYPETFQKRLSGPVSALPKSAIISFPAKLCTATAHIIAASAPTKVFPDTVFMILSRLWDSGKMQREDVVES